MLMGDFGEKVGTGMVPYSSAREHTPRDMSARSIHQVRFYLIVTNLVLILSGFSIFIVGTVLKVC